MLSSMNILDRVEIKKLQINREYNLLNRSVNFMYRCGTHTCSRHFRIISIMKVLYDKLKHTYVKHADIVTANSIRYTKPKMV